MAHIFINNRIVNENEALVSVHDRGFLFGDGLFETIRSYNGYVLNLTDHINRLRASAKAFKIAFNYTDNKIESIINELIELNVTPNAYIRLTLSRGIGSIGSGFKIPSSLISNEFTANKVSDKVVETNIQHNITKDQTFIIFVRQLSGYSEKHYKNGMLLTISKHKRSTTCPISSHKSANFLTNILVREEAVEKGADEVVLLNTDGFVAECSASNLFIVTDNTVVTPSLNVNILPGITRKTVLNICRKKRIDCREESFDIHQLNQADECFITNSLMEVMPVAKIDDKTFNNPLPGKLTTLLMAEYKNLM